MGGVVVCCGALGAVVEVAEKVLALLVELASQLPAGVKLHREASKIDEGVGGVGVYEGTMGFEEKGGSGTPPLAAHQQRTCSYSPPSSPPREARDITYCNAHTLTSLSTRFFSSSSSSSASLACPASARCLMVQLKLTVVGVGGEGWVRWNKSQGLSGREAGRIWVHGGSR